MCSIDCIDFTGVINNITAGCEPGPASGIMHGHALTWLTGTSHVMEPLLMLLFTPVLFPYNVFHI